MTYQTEFRDGATARALISRIQAEAARLGPIKLMEVCGSHTMAICRYGIRSLLPDNVQLVSGPGCPVCVTADEYIDRAVAMARLPDVLVTTFGDLMRVPGSVSSLEQVKAAGAGVQVVFSPLDAVELAAAQPHQRVVFLGIGFETTAPAVALAIRDASRRGLGNFHVLCGHKVMPPALRALAESGTQIQAFLLPGHVSAIIGTHSYEFLARDYGIACSVAGFEPLDILDGILRLLRQIAVVQPTVENGYARLVKPAGNRAAQAMLEDVFEPVDASWRGIGVIAGSGLAIRDAYAGGDAERAIPVTIPPAVPRRGCICGEILLGQKRPEDCPLFGRACTPTNPVGACMVSSEGSCAASYRYQSGKA